MNVIDEIAVERQRQIDVEGWSASHDDEHQYGEIANAAAAYAQVAANQAECDRLGLAGECLDDMAPPDCWRWGHDWFKPKDSRRNLVRAAALIVAEIERIDRVAKRQRRLTRAEANAIWS